MFVSDFETTKRNNVMCVWLADVCDMINYTHNVFTNIKDWFIFIKEKCDVIYFHNLKFDGTYIVDYLLKHGYEYSEEDKSYTFSALVTDVGLWYMITIVLPEKKIVIYDSLKKIPLSVRNMAKSYNLPCSKREIDYNADRPEGYIPTEKEVDYVKRDTEIVARALKIMLSEGMKSMTAASCALYEYKSTVNFEQKFATKFYQQHYEVERFCRKSYFGGVSWVNPDIKEKIVKHGLVYDYNSMYPSVMLNYPYPVGKPIRFYGESKDGYLFIARCKVNVIKKSGKIPTLRYPDQHKWIEDEYNGEMILTSVDIETAKINYYGEIEILDGYEWKGEKGIFDNYIKHWRQVKETNTGGKRQIAKLMLNSLYGKFGTSPIKNRKQPLLVENIVKWKTSVYEEGKVLCVPVASFITAYARKELTEGAENSKGIVCYCDTDSLHIYSDGKKAAGFNGKVHKKEFGCWKLENRVVRAKFLRQKTYIEETPTGKLLIAACGCPVESKKYITFDNFKIGASFKGKLMPKTIEGGCCLEEKRFTIREPLMRF